jgi:hypothetical protein
MGGGSSRGRETVGARNPVGTEGLWRGSTTKRSLRNRTSTSTNEVSGSGLSSSSAAAATRFASSTAKPVASRTFRGGTTSNGTCGHGRCRTSRWGTQRDRTAIWISAGGSSSGATLIRCTSPRARTTRTSTAHSGYPPRTIWLPGNRARLGTQRASGKSFFIPTGAVNERRFRELCLSNGIVPPVGNTGICFDNAAAEAFNATLKKELIHLHVWSGLKKVRQTVFWIHRNVLQSQDNSEKLRLPYAG